MSQYPGHDMKMTIACDVVEEFRSRITGKQPVAEVVEWFEELPEGEQQQITTFAEGLLHQAREAFHALADSPFFSEKIKRRAMSQDYDAYPDFSDTTAAQFRRLAEAWQGVVDALVKDVFEPIMEAIGHVCGYAISNMDEMVGEPKEREP